jgi:hypothetical protein
MKGEGIMFRRVAPSLLLACMAVVFSGLFEKAKAAEPIVLWPQGAPGALGHEPEDVPTLTP